MIDLVYIVYEFVHKKLKFFNISNWNIAVLASQTYFFCYLGCNLKSYRGKKTAQKAAFQNSKESNMATNFETKKLDLPKDKLVPREQVLVFSDNIDTVREGTGFMDLQSYLVSLMTF